MKPVSEQWDRADTRRYEDQIRYTPFRLELEKTLVPAHTLLTKAVNVLSFTITEKVPTRTRAFSLDMKL